MKKWGVLLALAAGQFVMVLDSTVMNVSISQLVIDLHTSVTSIQLAITTYTLVMAAFMLTGGKLGDLLGRRRAFVIGLAVYGTGSLITALSVNIYMLLFGWSLVEGLGAVLVVPAIMALTAGNYSGRDRGMAYGLLGGVAAAGAAVGPLLGGWMTTNLSWRYVFAGETVLVLVLIVTSRIIKDAPVSGERQKLDLGGAALSAVGLSLVVLGILRSGTWGFVAPRNPPSISGTELTLFGFSPTIPVILVGFGILYAFISVERSRLAAEKPVLLKLDLFGITSLRAGLASTVVLQFTIAGTFFVLPLYLQIVLGLDSFQSGKAILPLSIGAFVTAIFAGRLGATVSPKRLIRTGLVVIACAEASLLAVLDPNLDSRPFLAALGIAGVGIGLVASQVGNVIQSSVDHERSSEAAGVQGTAQNLGASLGTALIGAVLLSGLASGFQSHIATSPDLSSTVKAQAAAAAAKGVPFVPAEQVQTAATKAGLDSASVSAVVDTYSDAQLAALKSALGVLAVLVALGLLATGGLPDQPMIAAGDESDEPDSEGPDDEKGKAHVPIS